MLERVDPNQDEQLEIIFHFWKRPKVNGYVHETMRRLSNIMKSPKQQIVTIFKIIILIAVIAM